MPAERRDRMKKTHQWMLFFLFLFFVSEILACTKKEEKLVFYQTTQIQKMDDSKEDTQFFQEEAQTSQVSESSLHETTQAAVETIAVYLCGEVCKPGVYVLQAGSRLYQAVEGSRWPYCKCSGRGSKSRPDSCRFGTDLYSKYFRINRPD